MFYRYINDYKIKIEEKLREINYVVVRRMYVANESDRTEIKNDSVTLCQKNLLNEVFILIGILKYRPRYRLFMES